jgi:cytochrome c biogenesis protein CcdA
VLAMIPLTIAFVSGDNTLSNWKRSLLFSLSLMLGLSVSFTALGILAALLGGQINLSSPIWRYLFIVICFGMGLHLMELVKIPLPRIIASPNPKKGMLGAFLLGILFGFISTPCAAPILVVLLTYLTVKGNSVFYGGALLFTYAMGHGVLILIAGTSIGAAKGILESRKINQINLILRRVAGVVIILVGLYFIK